MSSPIASTSSVLFEIMPKTPVSTIARELAEKGIIDNAHQFSEGMSRLELDRKVKAGQYRIEAGLSYQSLMEKFISGDVVQHKFAIVEGLRFQDIIASLAQAKHLDHTLAGMSAQEIWERVAPRSEHFYEGMLYPDTYIYTEGGADVNLLKKSHMRLVELLEEEWEKRDSELTLESPYEALILASIIEKETGVKAEREMISSVFHNRLRIGIRLQSDPTVIYGLGDSFDGNLTRAHLEEDTTYNSYTRRGLPPTPIAIASVAAIKAALHPATSKYLYFVADNTGGHHFSKNLREHNNAVNRFQRNRQ